MEMAEMGAMPVSGPAVGDAGGAALSGGGESFDVSV